VTEQELLIDCLRRLNTARLEYFLTGSMASNYWGFPRTTHDIDFVIEIAAADVSRIVESFHPEFYIDEAMVRSASRPPFQFNAIDTRSSMKVDFWTAHRTPFESEMFRRRLRVTLFGEPAWIATKEDVILHKLVWMRISPSERQKNDISGIILVQRDSLDWTHLRLWAERLEVADALGEFASGRIRPKNT
jgi:hypothetical protein